MYWLGWLTQKKGREENKPKNGFLDDEKHVQEMSCALQVLTSLPFTEFWTTVIFSEDLLTFVDKFLVQCARPYDLSSSGFTIVAKINQLDVQYNDIYRHILTLFYRLSLPAPPGSSVDVDAPNTRFMRGILDIPKLINISNIYTSSNKNVVLSIISNYFVYNRIDEQYFISIFQTLYDKLRDSYDEIQRLNQMVFFLAVRSSQRLAEELKWRSSFLKASSILLDASVTLQSIYEVFEEHLLFNTCTSTLAESPDEVRNPVPLMAICEDVYLLLLQSKWDEVIANADGFEALQLATHRCRRILCRSLMLMAERCRKEALEQDREDVVKELSFWFCQFLENSCEAGDERLKRMFGEDLYYSGLPVLLEKWKTCELIDVPAIQLRLFALSQEKVNMLCAKPNEESSTAVNGAVSDKEEKLIIAMQEVFNYGSGFLLLCIRHFNGDANEAATAIIQETLPEGLSNLKRGSSIPEVMELLMEMQAKQHYSQSTTDVDTQYMNTIDYVSSLSTDAQSVPTILPLTQDERLKVLELWDPYDDEFDDSTMQLKRPEIEPNLNKKSPEELGEFTYRSKISSGCAASTTSGGIPLSLHDVVSAQSDKISIVEYANDGKIDVVDENKRKQRIATSKSKKDVRKVDEKQVIKKGSMNEGGNDQTKKGGGDKQKDTGATSSKKDTKEGMKRVSTRIKKMEDRFVKSMKDVLR